MIIRPRQEWKLYVHEDFCLRGTKEPNLDEIIKYIENNDQVYVCWKNTTNYYLFAIYPDFTWQEPKMYSHSGTLAERNLEHLNCFIPESMYNAIGYKEEYHPRSIRNGK